MLHSSFLYSVSRACPPLFEVAMSSDSESFREGRQHPLPQHCIYTAPVSLYRCKTGGRGESIIVATVTAYHILSKIYIHVATRTGLIPGNTQFLPPGNEANTRP